MNRSSVKESITSIKTKNWEGNDQIPQRMLVDGMDFLLNALTGLFQLIYEERKVHEQWLVMKTIPIFKNKCQYKDIQNYRLDGNLCAAPKIFKKLIIK
jgi:hypothetical protein